MKQEKLESDNSHLSEAIDRLSNHLGGAKEQDLTIKQLDKGSRNSAFLLRGDDFDRVLRLSGFPPAESNFYENEINNMKAAAAGLSPHVYFADCVDGTMLLEFVDGEVMDADAIRNWENTVSCAQLLHQLHTIEGFQDDYDIFQIIRKNVNQIRKSGFEMSPEQARAIELVKKIREILFNNGVPNCASHNDVFSGNFVRLKTR